MSEAASIPALLNELDKLGANVEQLRKLYASGRQLDALRESHPAVSEPPYTACS